MTAPVPITYAAALEAESAAEQAAATARQHLAGLESAFPAALRAERERLAAAGFHGPALDAALDAVGHALAQARAEMALAVRTLAKAGEVVDAMEEEDDDVPTEEETA